LRKTVTPVLRLSGIEKHFSIRGTQKKVHALRGISLDFPLQKTTGIVGESGSGKSTIARILLGQYAPNKGYFAMGEAMSPFFSQDDWKQWRKRVTMVFQDPFSSLNPRLTVSESIQEPLIIHAEKKYSAKEREKIAAEKLELTGISASAANRYPHEFSGGQRQRIGIARALVTQPEVMILDEPVSALDVSVQAQIINLLVQLKQETSITYLFIAHDISVVRHLSDYTVVIHAGEVMEYGETKHVLSTPSHPYTQTLLQSVPEADPSPRKKIFTIAGELPSPTDVITGCSFAGRCPRVKQVCRDSKPEKSYRETGYFYCHFPLKQQN